jgi:hypothetical protein
MTDDVSPHMIGQDGLSLCQVLARAVAYYNDRKGGAAVSSGLPPGDDGAGSPTAPGSRPSVHSLRGPDGRERISYLEKRCVDDPSVLLEYSTLVNAQDRHIRKERLSAMIGRLREYLRVQEALSLKRQIDNLVT